MKPMEIIDTHRHLWDMDLFSYTWCKDYSECFSWDRVMFGSDWPVCTLSAPFKKWVETLSTLTQDASEEQRNKLFHENARRIYKLA